MLRPTEEIGGAVVRRKFTRGGKALLAGHLLSAEDAQSIPTANLRALEERGYITTWPRVSGSQPSSQPSGPLERHLVTVGPGKFIVVEGRSLTPEPIGSEEAKALRDANKPAAGNA